MEFIKLMTAFIWLIFGLGMVNAKTVLK